MSVRTRFAPSPTGYLHLGSARTALFNWAFARHHQGCFVLRIEDTDRERSTAESERGVLRGLEWLGLAWDEGPFRQSERSERHANQIERLLAEGKAYRCICTREELEERKQKADGRRAYDGRCRELGAGPRLRPPHRSPSTGPQRGPLLGRPGVRPQWPGSRPSGRHDHSSLRRDPSL